jgi:hypothetical protein
VSTEQTNEHAEIAARLLGNGSPAYLHPTAVPAAQVHALLALAAEVAAMRKQLADDLGGTGALAGFLDEIAIRISSDDDSIAEAIRARGGESR